MASSRFLETSNRWRSLRAPLLSTMAYSTTENVLCFSSGGNFFVLNDDFSAQKIAEREDKIITTCRYNGEIYDAGKYGIFNTITNKLVSKRKGEILTLCAHKGKLYDAGDYNQIFETFPNRKIVSRSGPVSKLFSYQGNLYDYGDYNKIEIFNTLENKAVATRGDNIEKIICFEDRLYDVSRDGKMYETLSNELVVDTKREVDFFLSYTQLYHNLSNKPAFQIPEEFLDTLRVCMHEGVLYGYEKEIIFDTIKNQKFFFHSDINSLKSYPKRVFIKKGIKLNG